MYQSLQLFQTADAMARHAGTRQAVVARNIANADTASSSTEDVYRARHPVFKASFNQMLGHSQEGLNPQDETAGVAVLGIVESDAPLQPRYEPDHPMANEDGYVYYPNVNVVEEMTNMISASRSFQMNVDVLNSAKQMMQRVLSIGQ